jgi:glycosyltransferase involved in cell wall biosynthesis
MSQNDPTISVLMCCYNAEAFVVQAVESILGQSFGDFRFIIVDDGSNDGTRQILGTYASKDKRIALVEKENTGLTHSLNVGLSRAEGPFIARMDADDVSLPDRFAIQLSWLRRHPEVGVLGTGCRIIDAKGEFTGRCFSSTRTHQSILRCMARPGRGVPVLHPTVMMRRDIVRRVGGYNPRFPLAQDIDLVWRVSDLTESFVIPDVLLLLRKHPGCVSVVRRPEQLLSHILAGACYRARRQGLPDPAQASDSEWEEFRRRAHAILERDGVYAADGARIRMASGAAGHCGVRRYARFLRLLAADPSLWVVAVSRYRWRCSLRQVTRLAEARVERLSPPVDVCSDMM